MVNVNLVVTIYMIGMGVLLVFNLLYIYIYVYIMNTEVVTDLIAFSRVLRLSTDPSIRKVFINHDLTPREAEAKKIP